MPNEHTLTPAEPAELEQALAHALQFDGRRPFKVSGEMMAKITAAHLAKCLEQSGYVVMKKPPARGHGSDGLKTPAKGHLTE